MATRRQFSPSDTSSSSKSWRPEPDESFDMEGIANALPEKTLFVVVNNTLKEFFFIGKMRNNVFTDLENGRMIEVDVIRTILDLIRDRYWETSNNIKLKNTDNLLPKQYNYRNFDGERLWEVLEEKGGKIPFDIVKEYDDEEPISQSGPSQVVEPTTQVPRRPNPYNIFMQNEVSKIEKAYPGIDHKQAFKMAAANWNAQKQQI